MYKCVPVFVCFLGLIYSISTHASGVELKNLRWTWEVYDEDAGHFVPYFDQAKTEAIRFKLELNKYRNSYLKLTLPGNHFVWIEDELVFASLKSKTNYFAIDSLQTIYGKGHVYLTLHSPVFNSGVISTTVVNLERTDSISLEQIFFLERADHDQFDLFVIVSIATLSLIALFRAFNFRLFQEYFSIGKALQLRQNFDLIVAHSPITWPNIGFIIFYAVLVGNTVINMGLFQADFKLVVPFNLSNSNSFVLGLKVTIFCFLLMLAKLLIVSLGSELFKLKKIRLTHFFTYFRLSFIMAIVMFSLSVINGIFGGILIMESWSIIQIMIVLAWSCRLILIFFVLNKIYTFRKLHLFSYLCSSELIPLLLFFKVFLK